MAHILAVPMRTLRNSVWRNGPRAHNRRRTIKHFADKMGLLYFGLVDQHSDEHHVVRGLTVSATHQDESYTVGTYEGYDITLVDRLDTLQQPDGTTKQHNWLILEVMLHTKKDIPHIFLGKHDDMSTTYAALTTTFGALQPIQLGTFENYSPEFTSRYGLFATPTHAIEVERLFPAAVARTIGAHFWPLSAEIYEGAIYLYAANQSISSSLLDMLVNDGIWLAHHLDIIAEQV